MHHKQPSLCTYKIESDNLCRATSQNLSHKMRSGTDSDAADSSQTNANCLVGSDAMHATYVSYPAE